MRQITPTLSGLTTFPTSFGYPPYPNYFGAFLSRKGKDCISRSDDRSSTALLASIVDDPLANEIRLSNRLSNVTTQRGIEINSENRKKTF